MWTTVRECGLLARSSACCDPYSHSENTTTHPTRFAQPRTGCTPIGVIEPGAYADLLIMDGNPLEDTSVLTKPETNLNVIMKDGKIYKNTLG